MKAEVNIFIIEASWELQFQAALRNSHQTSRVVDGEVVDRSEKRG